MVMDGAGSNCAEEFLVRVKYEQKLRFVRIPKEGLNITVFLQEGLSWKLFWIITFTNKSLLAFKSLFIDEKEKLKVHLFDNLMTPISPEMFVDVVKCFGNGSGFFIHLVMELALDNAKSIMTADVSGVIENYVQK